MVTVVEHASVRSISHRRLGGGKNRQLSCGFNFPMTTHPKSKIQPKWAVYMRHDELTWRHCLSNSAIQVIGAMSQPHIMIVFRIQLFFVFHLLIFFSPCSMSFTSNSKGTNYTHNRDAYNGQVLFTWLFFNLLLQLLKTLSQALHINFLSCESKSKYSPFPLLFKKNCPLKSSLKLTLLKLLISWSPAVLSGSSV